MNLKFDPSSQHGSYAQGAKGFFLNFGMLVVGLLLVALFVYLFDFYCKKMLEKNGIQRGRSPVSIDQSLSGQVVPSDVVRDSEQGHLKAPPVQPRWVRLQHEGRLVAPPKFGAYRAKAYIAESKKVIYDVTLTFDQFGRRVVGRNPRKGNDTAIVFLGCSFTMGEGVENSEAFPSLLSEKFVRSNVYNLGVPGGSLNEALYRMTHDDQERFLKIDAKKVILVYTFFQTHLFRQKCDLSCSGGNDWMLQRPKYDIESGKVRFVGFFSEFYSKNRVLKSVYESNIFRYFNIQFPDVADEKNIDLSVKLLEEIRHEYAKRFQVLDVYVYIHDLTRNDTVNSFAHKLVEANIKPVIANRQEMTRAFGEDTGIPYDGHPSALGHKVIANSLHWFIFKDHPYLEGGFE